MEIRWSPRSESSPQTWKVFLDTAWDPAIGHWLIRKIQHPCLGLLLKAKKMVSPKISKDLYQLATHGIPGLIGPHLHFFRDLVST